jgi:hypothetical protein
MQSCWYEFKTPETIPAEIAALLPEQIERHSAALVPVAKRPMLGMLARLSVHYPDQRSEAEWMIIHADYAEALAEMPADILAEATRLHLLRSRFYPKLCELMDEARPLLCQRRDELRHLQELETVETPEERAERWERERAAAEAKRLADIEAKCQAEPHLRAFYRWWRVFEMNINAVQWLPWLEQQTRSRSVEQIESWHQQLADEKADKPWPRDFDAFARLCAIARQNGGGSAEIPWE